MPSGPTHHLQREAPARVPNVNTLWASVLVDELARSGLCEVCISPGSRSAPLVFEFAAHPRIRDHSIVDERSAGFFALGLARVHRRPVALLCTSGTAAANYYPAVCEAGRDNIPLLVLTGDRPPEDHDCGAQQVMDQAGLYGSQVRWFHQVAQPEATPHKLAYLRSLVCRALHRAQYRQPGPVHLDLPFRKPLEPDAVAPGDSAHVPQAAVDACASVIEGRANGVPWLRIHSGQPKPSGAAAGQLVEALDDARRPLIIAGTDPRGPDYRAELTALADRAAIPVLAEPGSGLRHWSACGPNVIGRGDLIAGSRFYARWGMPDVILRTGNAPLSWATQALLKNAREAIQITVSSGASIVDPDHTVSLHLDACPEYTFGEAAIRLRPGDARRRQAWLQAHRRADALAASELQARLTESGPFSAPGMWHVLGGLLPEGCALYFSSSMVVRHVDTFMCAHTRNLEVYFNRGLNGIDGVVSTAAGIATARRGDRENAGPPTVLVIGDVALRHDATALLLARETGLNITVLVVDNQGGEIFEYLPSAGYGEVHERHFATSGRTAVREVIPRGVDLLEPSNWAEFVELVSASVNTPGQQVIRFATDRRADRRLRRALFEGIDQRLERDLPGPENPILTQA